MKTKLVKSYQQDGVNIEIKECTIECGIIAYSIHGKKDFTPTTKDGKIPSYHQFGNADTLEEAETVAANIIKALKDFGSPIIQDKK